MQNAGHLEKGIKCNKIKSSHSHTHHVETGLESAYLVLTAGQVRSCTGFRKTLLNWLAVGCVRALSGPIIIAS